MVSTLFTVAALFAVILMGCSSAAILWAISVWLRGSGTRSEHVFAAAGLLGFALLLAAGWLESPILSAASVLLWGWVVLPVMMLPPFVVWGVATRAWRRFSPAAESRSRLGLGDESVQLPAGASLRFVEGDLLRQPVDVIVNPWNRNIIPWWLLLPQGVSGAIRRRAGLEPFRHVARAGPIPLGGAVATGAGRLPYKAIIHVAGIGLSWRASRRSIQDSTRNALAKAAELGAASVAMPLIGAGTGGVRPAEVEAWMSQAVRESAFSGEVLIVRYRGEG